MYVPKISNCDILKKLKLTKIIFSKFVLYLYLFHIFGFLCSDKLGNDEEDKLSVLCDLESILTCHRRSLGSKGSYTRGNGWLDIIAPLISLKQPRDQTCALFQVRNLFILIHRGSKIWYTLMKYIEKE